jgi:hypothetical protein
LSKEKKTVNLQINSCRVQGGRMINRQDY